MRILITSIVLFFGCIFSAQAQTEQKGMAHSVSHACVIAEPGIWNDLQLDADQRTKIELIQSHANTEAVGVIVTVDHEAEVKGVLTPVQFDKWQRWCAANQDALKEEKK